MDGSYWDKEVNYSLYHGTSCERAQKIVNSKKWYVTQDKQWLGDGVYFMESPHWAKRWALKGKHKIPLNNCCIVICSFSTKRHRVLDLCNIMEMELLKEFARSFLKEESQEEWEKGKFVGKVINGFCMAIEMGMIPNCPNDKIELIRGFFQLGESLANDKSVPKRGQIQICVRRDAVDKIEIEEIKRCKAYG